MAICVESPAQVSWKRKFQPRSSSVDESWGSGQLLPRAKQISADAEKPWSLMPGPEARYLHRLARLPFSTGSYPTHDRTRDRLDTEGNGVLHKATLWLSGSRRSSSG